MRILSATLRHLLKKQLSFRDAKALDLEAARQHLHKWVQDSSIWRRTREQLLDDSPLVVFERDATFGEPELLLQLFQAHKQDVKELLRAELRMKAQALRPPLDVVEVDLLPQPVRLDEKRSRLDIVASATFEAPAASAPPAARHEDGFTA